MGDLICRRPVQFAFYALLVLFLLFPGIDLGFSQIFFEPRQGFYLKNGLYAQFFYQTLPVVSKLLYWGLPLAILASHAPQGPERLRRLRGKLAYLLLVLALGPGLVVNGVFKSHWGRARPADVVEFGGQQPFTPAFVVSPACRRNCSFVSGHAATGFLLMSVAFLDRPRRRRWLWAGIALGGAAGLGRIMQGSHFLSDVIFSGFFVYFTAWLVDLGMHRIGPDDLERWLQWLRVRRD